jgi:hypothetical protein
VLSSRKFGHRDWSGATARLVVRVYNFAGANGVDAGASQNKNKGGTTKPKDGNVSVNAMTTNDEN